MEIAKNAKLVVLKDGRRISIRSYRPADKEELVSMYASLSQESLRWSMPPYDRQRIEWWTSNLENRIILIAQDQNRIVGHLQISIGTSPRFREMGDLFIYLNQAYQNVGLGAALMRRGYCLSSRTTFASNRAYGRSRQSPRYPLVREGRISVGGFEERELSRRGWEVS